MSFLQSRTVKTIGIADDSVALNTNKKRWLNEGNDKVLLFRLGGPMIFGVAKAINREHNAIKIPALSQKNLVLTRSRGDPSLSPR